MATRPSPKISNTAFANVTEWLANIGPSYHFPTALVAADHGNGLRSGQKKSATTAGLVSFDSPTAMGTAASRSDYRN
jgi:hypothetical protein